MWTSKGRAKRGETMGCAQSKRVRFTKPGCVSFLLLQTNAGIRRDCSEGPGVLKLLAGSKIIWPQRQERIWRLPSNMANVFPLRKASFFWLWLSWIFCNSVAVTLKYIYMEWDSVCITGILLISALSSENQVQCHRGCRLASVQRHCTDKGISCLTMLIVLKPYRTI